MGWENISCPLIFCRLQVGNTSPFIQCIQFIHDQWRWLQISFLKQVCVFHQANLRASLSLFAFKRPWMNNSLHPSVWWRRGERVGDVNKHFQEQQRLGSRTELRSVKTQQGWSDSCGYLTWACASQPCIVGSVYYLQYIHISTLSEQRQQRKRSWWLQRQTCPTHANGLINELDKKAHAASRRCEPPSSCWVGSIVSHLKFWTLNNWRRSGYK